MHITLFFLAHPPTHTHAQTPTQWLIYEIKASLGTVSVFSSVVCRLRSNLKRCWKCHKKKKTTHYPPKWTTNTLISLHFKFSFQQNPKMSLFPLCSVLLHCPPSPEQISLPSPPHHLEDVMPLGSVSTRLPLPKTHYVTLLKGQCT